MQIIHQQDKGFYALSEEGKKIGELLYVPLPELKQLRFEHTIVEPEAEGQGVAKALVNYGVAYVREHNLKIVPSCPYVSALFKRKPADYADVIA